MGIVYVSLAYNLRCTVCTLPVVHPTLLTRGSRVVADRVPSRGAQYLIPSPVASVVGAILNQVGIALSRDEPSSSRQVFPLVHIKRSGLESVPCHIQNTHPVISPTSSKQWHVFARDLRRPTANSRTTGGEGIVVKHHEGAHLSLLNRRHQC